MRKRGKRRKIIRRFRRFTQIKMDCYSEEKTRKIWPQKSIEKSCELWVVRKTGKRRKKLSPQRHEECKKNSEDRRNEHRTFNIEHRIRRNEESMTNEVAMRSGLGAFKKNG